mmetsp:Transcript_6660/g.14234  ORF Transcript_6660/g.14234 Transcript_6660/m.14234 type:complete len:354 (+) Transcript_6660:1454-2515(+)
MHRPPGPMEQALPAASSASHHSWATALARPLSSGRAAVSTKGESLGAMLGGMVGAGSATVHSTLPMCLPEPRNRKAAPALLRPSKTVVGRGLITPASTAPHTSFISFLNFVGLRIRTSTCAEQYAAPSANSLRSTRVPSSWSRFPISTNRPKGATNSRDRSMASPARLLRIKSIPSGAARRAPKLNAELSRELKMLLSGTPRAVNVSRLGWEEHVPKTWHRQANASWTAAMPTPPAAACTITFSSSSTLPSHFRASHAVQYARLIVDAGPASSAAGTTATQWTGVVVYKPQPPRVIPATRSPGQGLVTFSPTRVTVPTNSPPTVTLSPRLTTPVASNTSRKFNAQTSVFTSTS